MDTLIKFRQKEFGKLKEFMKTPTGILSATGVTVSTANLATNVSRHRKDKEYQEKQLEAMDRLTNSINGLDKTVKASDPNSKNKNTRMIIFRRKDFSIKSDTINGAVLGSVAGSLAAKIPFFRKSMGVKGDMNNTMAIIGSGTIIGAALGLLVGLTKEAVMTINHKTTVDKRLLQVVSDNLKKSGLHEGIDYTRDPKIANELKIKVCIVISKNSGSLQLLVNTVAEPKLKSVAKDMTKNIPNSATSTTKLSDKYNDITISTISDSSADAGLITGIAEYFIHHGYPVYLVEVG